MHVLKRVKENLIGSRFSVVLSLASENENSRNLKDHLIILMCQRFDRVVVDYLDTLWRSRYCCAKKTELSLFWNTMEYCHDHLHAWKRNRLQKQLDRNSQNTFQVNSLELLPHTEHRLPTNTIHLFVSGVSGIVWYMFIRTLKWPPSVPSRWFLQTSL